MARDAYYEEQYYDEEQMEDGPPEGGGEETAIGKVPWFAIAFLFHVLLLFAIWGLPMSTRAAEDDDSIAQDIPSDEKEEPEIIPPDPPLEEERPEEEVQDPVEDPRMDEATDDHNEDPTDQPNEDLAPSDNPDDSKIESPHPNKNNYNSSLGLGGGLGGGGGPGGAGGYVRRRSRGGGGRPTDPRVEMALRWLADHQSDTGSWHPSDFPAAGEKHGRFGSYDNKDGFQDAPWSMAEPGLTGLAVLAFLGAGYDHKNGPPGRPQTQRYKRVVQRALRYLVGIQDADGCFGSREDNHFVYNHAICTMAMAEAFDMTGSLFLKPSAQKAVDFIAEAQNQDPDREDGGWLGWRYGVKPGDSDSSVTGWMALALKSARTANFDVPQRCWDGALRLLDDMTREVNGYPKTGYNFPGGDNARLRDRDHFLTNPAMDAISVMTRIFVSLDGSLREDPMVRAQADVIIAEQYLPTLEDPNKIDFYYWYYAALAMFQMDGKWWRTWEKAMLPPLMDSQRMDPLPEGQADGKTADGLEYLHACHGSWDTNTAWGNVGGRVYTTAINCLTFEVYYRYERVSERKNVEKH
jgi:hypothetical protein